MSKTKWDEKAANYTRFEPIPTKFQQKVFDFMDKNQIELENKSVLDIGCGTGVYTLHLAKKALHVDALDFSKQMLNVLQEDAKKYNISGIKTIFTTFDDFNIQKYYDVVFCSMTPAVSQPKSFEKMDKSGNKKLFLGWGGKRESSLHGPIFKAFGGSYNVPRGGLDLLEWLKGTKRDFEYTILDETHTSTYDLPQAIENVSWHLGINKVEFSKEKLKSILEKTAQENGQITNTVCSKMVLATWG
jgi:SAM-dependent methyltransferase